MHITDPIIFTSQQFVRASRHALLCQTLLSVDVLQ